MVDLEGEGSGPGAHSGIGEGNQFFVIDANTRSSRSNVLDAMASAHVYRDSLRLRSRRPEASLLLVPSRGGTRWLEQPAYHFTHRVGVSVLSPDTGTRWRSRLNCCSV